MIEIGKYNVLNILRLIPIGMILCDEAGNEILLPRKYVPELPQSQRTLRVFVYLDNEQRPIATTLKPKLTLNQFGLLYVRQVSDMGAFLDWGVAKDLFVPFREQEAKMVEGNSYIVFLHIDPSTGRLMGSARRKRFLDKETITVVPGDEVELLVCERTEIGMSVIVNHLHSGMLYFNELFKPVKRGDKLKGYVKQVRPDGNIDVSLEPEGFAKIEPSAAKVLDALQKNGGYLALTDDSSPDEIRWELEMSKKTFKKAIGMLYKEKRIRIEPDGIHAV